MKLRNLSAAIELDKELKHLRRAIGAVKSMPGATVSIALNGVNWGIPRDLLGDLKEREQIILNELKSIGVDEGLEDA
jgi:hypothetical protein